MDAHELADKLAPVLAMASFLKEAAGDEYLQRRYALQQELLKPVKGAPRVVGVPGSSGGGVTKGKYALEPDERTRGKKILDWIVNAATEFNPVERLTPFHVDRPGLMMSSLPSGMAGRAAGRAIGEHSARLDWLASRIGAGPGMPKGLVDGYQLPSPDAVSDFATSVKLPGPVKRMLYTNQRLAAKAIDPAVMANHRFLAEKLRPMYDAAGDDLNTVMRIGDSVDDVGAAQALKGYVNRAGPGTSQAAIDSGLDGLDSIARSSRKAMYERLNTAAKSVDEGLSGFSLRNVPRRAWPASGRLSWRAMTRNSLAPAVDDLMTTVPKGIGANRAKWFGRAAGSAAFLAPFLMSLTRNSQTPSRVSAQRASNK